VILLQYMKYIMVQHGAIMLQRSFGRKKNRTEYIIKRVRINILYGGSAGSFENCAVSGNKIISMFVVQ